MRTSTLISHLREDRLEQEGRYERRGRGRPTAAGRAAAAATSAMARSTLLDSNAAGHVLVEEKGQQSKGRFFFTNF